MPRPYLLTTGGCGYLGSKLIRDLARDPRETKNLWDTQPDTVRRLTQRLNELAAE